MNSSFITISEAAQKTGRSLSTIRRLIKTITETDNHPDREAVEPTAKQVAQHKKKGENFTWRIREDVVLKNFDSAPSKEKKPEKQEQSPDILSVLQNELELKNRQIEKQWEVIHALNDRLREGNILMGSLQKRLALPQADATDAVVQEASAEPSTKASAASSSPVRKKGVFAWMRRSS